MCNYPSIQYSNSSTDLLLFYELINLLLLNYQYLYIGNHITFNIISIIWQDIRFDERKQTNVHVRKKYFLIILFPYLNI